MATHSEVWKKIKCQVRNLRSPIHEWELTSQDFELIVQTLQTNTCADDDIPSCIIFLIGCAEVYRRQLAPGCDWNDILSTIPKPIGQYDQASAKQFIDIAETRLHRKPMHSNHGRLYRARIFVEGGFPCKLTGSQNYRNAIENWLSEREMATVTRRNELRANNGVGGAYYGPVFFDLAWDFCERFLDGLFRIPDYLTSADQNAKWLLEFGNIGVCNTPDNKYFIENLLSSNSAKKRDLGWKPIARRLLHFSQGNAPQPCQYSIEIKCKHKIQLPIKLAQNGAIASLSLRIGDSQQEIGRYNVALDNGTIKGYLFTTQNLTYTSHTEKEWSTILSVNGQESTPCLMIPALEQYQSCLFFRKSSNGAYAQIMDSTQLEYPIIGLSRSDIPEASQTTIGGELWYWRTFANEDELPLAVKEYIPGNVPEMRIYSMADTLNEIEYFHDGEYCGTSLGWPSLPPQQQGQFVVLYSNTKNGVYQSPPREMPAEAHGGWFRVECKNGTLKGPRQHLVVVPGHVLDHTIDPILPNTAFKPSFRYHNISSLPFGTQQYDQAEGWKNLRCGEWIRYTFGNSTFRMQSPVQGLEWVDSEGIPLGAAIPIQRIFGAKLRATLHQRVGDVTLSLLLRLRKHDGTVLARIPISLQRHTECGHVILDMHSMEDYLLYKLFSMTMDQHAFIDLEATLNGNRKTLKVQRYETTNALQTPRPLFLLNTLQPIDDVVQFQAGESPNIGDGVWVEFEAMRSGDDFPEWNHATQPRLYANQRGNDELSPLRKILAEGNYPECFSELTAALRALVPENLGEQPRGSDWNLIKYSFLAMEKHRLPISSLWILSAVLHDDVTLIQLLKSDQTLRQHWKQILYSSRSDLPFDWFLVRNSLLADLYLNCEEMKEFLDLKRLGGMAKPIPYLPANGIDDIFSNIGLVFERLPLCKFMSSDQWRSESGYYANPFWRDYQRILIWLGWFVVHASREEYNAHIEQALQWYKAMQFNAQHSDRRPADFADSWFEDEMVKSKGSALRFQLLTFSN